MSDDPCACLFDHEAAMRRLINLLRDTQAECTDGMCNQSGPMAIGGNSMIIWTILWGLIALGLFFLRPNSMRSRPTESHEKPGSSSDGDNNQPPPPGIH